MKTWLSLTLLALMALPVALRADTELNFLKPGSWYQVTGPKSTPLTSAGTSPNASPDFNIGWIQLLQVGDGNWAFVEFDRIDIPRDAQGNPDHRGQVTINKDRMWINFAHISSVQAMDAPDYSRLMSKFAGGVKIVPYTPSTASANP